MAGHIIVEVMTEFFNTWLVVWTICYFSIYWETTIFQRGWNHQPDTFVFEAMLDSAFHELGILFSAATYWNCTRHWRFSNRSTRQRPGMAETAILYFPDGKSIRHGVCTRNMCYFLQGPSANLDIPSTWIELAYSRHKYDQIWMWMMYLDVWWISSGGSLASGRMPSFWSKSHAPSLTDEKGG